MGDGVHPSRISHGFLIDWFSFLMEGPWQASAGRQAGRLAGRQAGKERAQEGAARVQAGAALGCELIGDRAITYVLPIEMGVVLRVN